jgi:malate dehydrogenase
MVEAVVTDRKTLAPCAVYLRGEYGIENLFIGVPILLGKNGVERVVELDLDKSEMALLRSSATSVKKGVDDLNTFFEIH